MGLVGVMHEVVDVQGPDQLKSKRGTLAIYQIWIFFDSTFLDHCDFDPQYEAGCSDLDDVLVGPNL